jgi:phage shock protein E
MGFERLRRNSTESNRWMAMSATNPIIAAMLSQRASRRPAFTRHLAGVGYGVDEIASAVANIRGSIPHTEAFMRSKILLACLLPAAIFSAHAQSIPNDQIDYAEFKRIVLDTEAYRESRRLSEEDFIAASKDPNVIVLDARSSSAFALRRIKGAKNLPFTDFTAQSLAEVVPDKNAKILIYCNNNFVGSPRSFATKAAPASLNLSTYTSLRAYGYENVYELGPVLDVRNTNVVFEGKEVDI